MNYFFIKKPMKLSKYIIVVLLSVLFISGCKSVKNTLTGKQKNTDEFLVKKKSPLVLPPNFDDLPKPLTEINTIDNQSENIDFSSVLVESKNEKKVSKKTGKSLEKKISNILNSN